MTEAAIGYDTIVKGNLTGTPGTIGLIVHDTEASRLVAISAANVVDQECRIAETGVPVGTTSAFKPERYLSARLRPAASLLTVVLINEGVQIRDGRLRIRNERAFPTLNDDAGRLIGKEVLVHLPGRDPVEALVTSTTAKFSMRSPDSDGHAFYEGAIGLFLARGEERARRGDAGSLVTTTGGEVVGIVVSARGSATFAAPVAPLLGELRACVPLDADIVERHNLLAQQCAMGDPEADQASAPTTDEEATEVSLKAQEAGAAWEEAQRSNRKPALLRAAALIDESCFA